MRSIHIQNIETLPAFSESALVGELLEKLAVQQLAFEQNPCPQTAEPLAELEVNLARWKETILRLHYLLEDHSEGNAYLEEIKKHFDQGALEAANEYFSKLNSAHTQPTKEQEAFLWTVKSYFTQLFETEEKSFDTALLYFEKARKMSQNNRIGYEYARFLSMHRYQLKTAFELYEAILPAYQDLKQKDLRYWHDYLFLLSDLATFYIKLRRFEDAHKLLMEGLTMLQKLIPKNPDLFEFVQAGFYFTFASWASYQKQGEQAEDLYQLALPLYEKIAQDQSKEHERLLAVTLNNMAISQKAQNKLDVAAQNYHKSLVLYRKWAKVLPQDYLHEVAHTLSNLAKAEIKRENFETAEAHITEALALYRKLATQNPKAFLPDLTGLLVNAAMFYMREHPQPEKSVLYAQEAVEILQPVHTEAEHFAEDYRFALKVLEVQNAQK